MRYKHQGREYSELPKKWSGYSDNEVYLCRQLTSLSGACAQWLFYRSVTVLVTANLVPFFSHSITLLTLPVETGWCRCLRFSVWVSSLKILKIQGNKSLRSSLMWNGVPEGSYSVFIAALDKNNGHYFLRQCINYAIFE